MRNTPKNRQEWIFELLKSENLNYVETWAKYGQKWGIGKTTFDKDWNATNQRFSEYQNKVNLAKEKASIKLEVDGLTKGIRTKQQRQLTIENEILEIEEILRINDTEDFYIHGGNPKKWNRKFTPTEMIRLRTLKNTLNAELSKMDGSYSPIKADIQLTNTGVTGNIANITDEEIEYIKNLSERK